MVRDISNSDDMIDSRDVISRLENLQQWKDAVDEAQEELDSAKKNSEDEDGEDLQILQDELDSAKADFEIDKDEYESLKELNDEGEGFSEWEYGTTLIRETYFEEYAQQLAEETCEIDFSKLNWPMTCIDWEQAAKELQYDYSSVEFDGVTYYLQS